MSRIDDLQKEIVVWNRRLQKRKEQKAALGLTADPSIELEIEEIEARLADLKSELPAYGFGHRARIYVKTEYALNSLPVFGGCFKMVGYVNALDHQHISIFFNLPLDFSDQQAVTG